MVKPNYTPPARVVAEQLRKVRRAVADAQKPTGTEKARSLLQLGEAVSVLEVQVAELNARSVDVETPADVTISAATPGVFTTATRSMTFAAPEGGARVAMLHMSAVLERVTESGNITVWVEILQNGVSTWKRLAAFYVGDTASAPPDWGNPAWGEPIQLAVANAAEASMTLKLHAHVFVAGTVTARMKNITATLEYGARI